MPALNYFWKAFPFLLVIVAYLYQRYAEISFIEDQLLHALPYITGAAAFTYASMFNRWRFIAPIVVALLAYLVIQKHLQTPLANQAVLEIYKGLNIVVCISLLFSACLPEKGAFNRTGFSYLTVVVAIPFMLLGLNNELINWHGVYSIFHFADGIPSVNEWFDGPSLMLHSVCFVALFGLVVFRRQPADEAILITWLACAIVLVDFSLSEISSVTFSVLFIALFVLMQKSNFAVTYKDALTGISGRRALDDYLSTLGRRYAIAMMDVDHFKKFNDTHGHDVGDQVLRLVASKINRIEGGGRAFRYGGEEFTVVFSNRTAADIAVYLEAVRESIQNYSMTIRSASRLDNKKQGKQLRGKAEASNKKVSVTISIGVANSESGLKPDDVIKKADNLLYKAKEAGRNCTIKE